MSRRPIRSILIVKLSAIGDVIHSLPTLDAIRAQMPDVRIGWIVEELSEPLLRHHPHIDKVYVIPKKRWRGNIAKYFFSEIMPFFRNIRQDGWDATLDLQGLMKSGIASRASGAHLRVGHGGENSRELSWLFNNRRIETRKNDHHVVLQNMRLIEGLGLKMPRDVPRGTIGILEEEKRAMREVLRKRGWQGRPLLALNPGAGWSSKRWPAEHFATLGQMIWDRFEFRPLVFWAPGEEKLRDEILERLPVAVPAPPTRVRELAVLISLCTLFVGGDTGASHAAGLLGVPTITLFGPSDGARNAPWPAANDAGRVLQRTEMECISCWKRTCPLKGDDYLACLRGLTPEMVMHEVGDWISGVVEHARA